MLLIEGTSGAKIIWKQISYIHFNMLRKHRQTTFLNLLYQRLGDSFYRLKSSLFKVSSDGFYSSETIKYIIRYTGSPTMKQFRILNYDGKIITFYHNVIGINQYIIEKV